MFAAISGDLSEFSQMVKRTHRYIREIIFAQRRMTQFWQITTDKETLPKNSTSGCDDPYSRIEISSLDNEE